jgi:hypothetical protein
MKPRSTSASAAFADIIDPIIERLLLGRWCDPLVRRVSFPRLLVRGERYVSILSRLRCLWHIGLLSESQAPARDRQCSRKEQRGRQRHRFHRENSKGRRRVRGQLVVETWGCRPRWPFGGGAIPRQPHDQLSEVLTVSWSALHDRVGMSQARLHQELRPGLRQTNQATAPSGPHSFGCVGVAVAPAHTSAARVILLIPSLRTECAWTKSILYRTMEPMIATSGRS